MDVNVDAVADLIRKYDYPEILLHGHTHRPGVHQLQVDGHTCKRMVLGDWHDHAICARLDQQALQLIDLPLA
jgi:UDP-2,3-diacylglucosamine hydrolase